MSLFSNTSKYKPKRLLSKESRCAERVPKILIAAGFIAFLTAGAILGYSFIDDYLAGRRAQAVLAQIRAAVPAPASKPPPAAPEPVVPLNTTAPEDKNDTKPQYETVGVLSIPKLGLELPVLSEYSDSYLKVSVCRYKGVAIPVPERLVITGHNYRSHFGKLSELDAGDVVHFQNNNGTVYGYTVTEIINISMYDIEVLERGEWDVTLYTCDSDQSRRILIRCIEAK